MNTSNIVKAFKKEPKNPVDNRILLFKDKNKVIEHVWCLKWVKAFCETKDPQAWMKRRERTSIKLQAKNS